MFVCRGWKKRIIPQGDKILKLERKKFPISIKLWGVKSFPGFSGEKVAYVRFATLPRYFMVLKCIGSSIKN